jgi:hypothetical protein
MNADLILTPSGHLRIQETNTREGTLSGAWLERVRETFTLSQSQGLLALAGARPETVPSPSFSFWKDFAGRYLTQLCRTPESLGKHLNPIDPPLESELTVLVLSAPPMPGGEYLTIEVLRDLWTSLDSYARAKIAASPGGLNGWLKEQAPLWQPVGRGCFHLAENSRDPEFPFAFLATYAPSLSKGGRVQYQPLGKALQEYAGEQNKAALINLLSPVYQASEKIPFVKDLMASGDVFHPLAWTASEAYRLLKNIPLLEESGLLVRIADCSYGHPG